MRKVGYLFGNHRFLTWSQIPAMKVFECVGVKARKCLFLVRGNCVGRKASMSIGNEGEEKIPTYRELAALAKERDRQDKLAGKARARAKRVRSHVSGKDLAAENLVAENLAARYDGKKVGVEVLFGPEGKTQFIFRRLYRRSILGPDGEPQFIFRRVKGGVAGWTVSLAPVTISGYDTQRELSKGTAGGFWIKKRARQPLRLRRRSNCGLAFLRSNGCTSDSCCTAGKRLSTYIRSP